MMEKTAEHTQSARDRDHAEEIQLISFKVDNEEFGVEIENIKEILKMVEITPVPKSPGFLLGMINLRGTIIPVLDLKKRLKQEVSTPTANTRILVLSVCDDLSGIVVDSVSEVQRIAAGAVEPPPRVTRGIDRFFLQGVAKLRDNHKTSHLIMMLNLTEVLDIQVTKTRQMISGSSSLAELQTGQTVKDKIEEEQVVTFKLGEEEFGMDISSVKEILKVGETTAVPNVPSYVKGIQNIRDAVIPIIDMRQLVNMESLEQQIEELGIAIKERSLANQRILIVDIDNTTVGLLVDRVSEVSRLPKHIIDTTPAVISSYGKEIRGIARLNNGTRLILLLDETLLLSGEEMTAISQIREEQTAAQTAAEAAGVIEKQYVIFSVEHEEFGIFIDKVQEIFKPREITPLPKSPKFIKGVTNLRGNIIPVVDVTERFGITAQESSGQKDVKILVVLIKDTTVGLLVDNVREVLRIPENWIEDAPSLVLSNVDTGYLEGIAKLDKGKRIVLLLNIEEIMTKKEFARLSKIKEKVEVEAEVKVEEKKKKAKKKKG